MTFKDNMNILEFTHNKVQEILPERAAEAHKGDFGKILLLCGSVGYTGAAALSAMGALRSGAGLVFLGVPQPVYSILAAKLWEPVVFPLPDMDGCFSKESISKIDKCLKDKDAVLLGPGLGCNENTLAVTEYVLKHYNGPVVLDADGINVLAGHKDILRGRAAPTVLTPHVKEFERIAGYSCELRVESAVSLARELNAIILLKGHRTVITDGNTTYLNPTGNPGMAVGGSGDVLAGMIVSLIGQGIDPLKATAASAWLHGKAGDICAQQIGQYGMLPTDMLDVLPRLLK